MWLWMMLLGIQNTILARKSVRKQISVNILVSGTMGIAWVGTHAVLVNHLDIETKYSNKNQVLKAFICRPWGYTSFEFWKWLSISYEWKWQTSLTGVHAAVTCIWVMAIAGKIIQMAKGNFVTLTCQPLVLMPNQVLTSQESNYLGKLVPVKVLRSAYYYSLQNVKFIPCMCIWTLLCIFLF